MTPLIWVKRIVLILQIMQYDCNYDNLAPEGCTQYFFGVTTDLVKTYNFSGGHHLANQDQLICVRNVLILHQKTQKNGIFLYSYL